jgi:hypothetical protein
MSTTLSRRSLVTTAAALPALAVPAIAIAAAVAPDPIFAAIEEWKGVDAVYAKAIRAADAASTKFLETYGQMSRPDESGEAQAGYDATVQTAEDAQGRM